MLPRCSATRSATSKSVAEPGNSAAHRPWLARFSLPALGQTHMCPLRESLDVLSRRPSAGGSRPHFSAGEGRESEARAPNHQRAPVLAASPEPHLLLHQQRPSQQETCPPSALNAAELRAAPRPRGERQEHQRTPPTSTPPSPKRRAQSWLSARALPGRARGGRRHGQGLRQARRRVGRYGRPLAAGSLRGAAGFLAEPARLSRPGPALADGRLFAGSGWFPCGTSTATEVVNVTGAQRVAEPPGTSSELGVPAKPRARSSELVPSRTPGIGGPGRGPGVFAAAGATI